MLTCNANIFDNMHDNILVYPQFWKRVDALNFRTSGENVQLEASAYSLYIAEVFLQLASHCLFTLWCRRAAD